MSTLRVFAILFTHIHYFLSYCSYNKPCKSIWHCVFLKFTLLGNNNWYTFRIIFSRKWNKLWLAQKLVKWRAHNSPFRIVVWILIHHCQNDSGIQLRLWSSLHGQMIFESSLVHFQSFIPLILSNRHSYSNCLLLYLAHSCCSGEKLKIFTVFLQQLLLKLFSSIFSILKLRFTDKAIFQADYAVVMSEWCVG